MPPKPNPYPTLRLTLRHHYPLYLMEAAELAAFMVSACLFDILLFHPAFSPIHTAWLARLCMGASMGLTAVAIIKSPWGRASGAHFNPAISLTFFRLGKLSAHDTLFYCLAHFAGAVLGVGLVALVLNPWLADPHVNYVVTVPGIGGPPAAFAAELFMAALMMSAVLLTSTRPRLAPATPWIMGTLITFYVLLFAPVSGFSINPARTFGSAVYPPLFTAFWLYCTAPLLGMFLPAEIFLRLTRPHPATVPPGHTRPWLLHRHVLQRRLHPAQKTAAT